ncbi:lateral signaling target protein 2 homolog [Centroberyx gerrardi]
MNKIRTWLQKPKACNVQKSEQQLLSQFCCADADLSRLAAELDVLGSRREDQPRPLLDEHLRCCQENILTILNQMMDVCFHGNRTSKDFWVKFPEEFRHELAAECVAAGSSPLKQEAEGVAQQLTSGVARRQAGRDGSICPEMFHRALRRLDALLGGAGPRDLQLQQLTVLFCETTCRALQRGYISQTMIDQYEPTLMVTIPRLAILCGLLLFPVAALQLDGATADLSELFRPFQSRLRTIRDLLRTLTEEELWALEQKLCVTQELEANGRYSSAGTVEATRCFPACGSLSSLRRQGGVTPSSDFDLSCLVKCDVKEAEQQSGRFQQPADQMSGFLRLPSPNLSAGPSCIPKPNPSPKYRLGSSPGLFSSFRPVSSPLLPNLNPPLGTRDDDSFPSSPPSLLSFPPSLPSSPSPSLPSSPLPGSGWKPLYNGART